VHWFSPESIKLTFSKEHIMIYDVKYFSKSQNIPPTVKLLLSASNISCISLKETFSVEGLFFM
jgi:hypothetical protein